MCTVFRCNSFGYKEYPFATSSFLCIFTRSERDPMHFLKGAYFHKNCLEWYINLILLVPKLLTSSSKFNLLALTNELLDFLAYQFHIVVVWAVSGVIKIIKAPKSRKDTVFNTDLQVACSPYWPLFCPYLLMKRSAKTLHK